MEEFPLMSTTMKSSTRIQLGLGVLLTTTMIFANGCGSYSAPAVTPPPPPVIQNLYITNDSTVLKFALPTAATVDVAPTLNITGSNTGLIDPHRTALDASGNIYVTDYDNNSVSVFAATATGNIAPTVTISGVNTGLNGPNGIAIDSKGNIYVANSFGGSSNVGSITVFAAGATGNATPTATITGSNTGLSSPNGLALDSKGNIYVVNESGSNNGTVTEYAASPTGTINVAPTTTISGASTGLNDPHALALDSTGNIYVVNGNGSFIGGGTGSGNSVTVYSVGATGNATPTATISGTNTMFNDPNGIAVDAKGNIYVGNHTSVEVYAANPVGSVTAAPIYVLTGTTTTISFIHGVSVN
jgi:sugar lactone lactonase YvrE